MLNLNYNINKALGGRGCVGAMKYNYSASILIVGGGGGGATGLPQTSLVPGDVGYAPRSGGGGGGGAIYSGSISIIPNLIYNITVGNFGSGGGSTSESASNGQNGQVSAFFGFNDVDSNPLAITASGGYGGQYGNEILGGTGGNSGNLTINGSVTVASNTGGAGGTSSGGAGGGASFIANGLAGGTNAGGNGALAINSSYVPSTIGGGGGGGAKLPNQQAGLPNPVDANRSGGWGGGTGTGTGNQSGVAANSYGGGGGGGASANYGGGYGAGGNGSKGIVAIRYQGAPKAFVTNATTVTEGGFTTHIFETGSGTFLYTFPYPWEEPVIPYTVEECPPETNPPYLPQPRVDPYSSSLVLAIPGAIFKNGYVNVFNQVSEYDDISPYIVSGSILNPNTGKYYELSTTQSVLLTGSYGSYSASFDVNNFLNDGYRTSMFFTGSKACSIAPSGLAGSGLNLTSSKSFTIESWIAFPATASYATASGPPGNETVVINAIPNRVLAQKYQETIPASSSYLYVAGWSGNTAPPGLPRGFTPVSGSSVLFIDYKDGLGENKELNIFPASSSGWIPLQWKHYAVSLTAPTGSSDNAFYRQYINGTLVSQLASRLAINFSPTTPTEIFGESNPFIDPFNEASASQVAGAYYQDLRIYNGTNKNYTGSQFTPPQSMIISELEPYPQYNL
jgi:hypothetical protein